MLLLLLVIIKISGEISREITAHNGWDGFDFQYSFSSYSTNKSSGHTLLKAATLQSSVRGFSAREKSPLVSLLSYSSCLTRTDTAVKALLDSLIECSHSPLCWHSLSARGPQGKVVSSREIICSDEMLWTTTSKGSVLVWELVLCTSEPLWVLRLEPRISVRLDPCFLQGNHTAVRMTRLSILLSKTDLTMLICRLKSKTLYCSICRQQFIK